MPPHRPQRLLPYYIITRKISETMPNEVPIPAPLSADATAPASERYCKKFRREVKLYGLKEAQERWRVVCDYMQDEDWWPAVVREIEGTVDKIIEEKENNEQAERERQQESKPMFVINNESNGTKHVDQLNGVVEPGAEVTHTKQN